MTVLDDPGLQLASSALTTNAVANTNTVQAILAAPGVGLRYRIYGIDLAALPGTTGHIRLNAAVGHLACVPGGADHLVIPMGYPMNDNQALNFTDRSEIAGQGYLQATRYVIEDT